MTKDDVTKALRQAYNLGQIYWQQADSEYMSQHKKADQTEAKFQELLETTSAALEAKDEPANDELLRLRDLLGKANALARIRANEIESLKASLYGLYELEKQRDELEQRLTKTEAQLGEAVWNYGELKREQLANQQKTSGSPINTSTALEAKDEPEYYGLTKDHLWMSISKEHYDRLKPEFRMACYTTPPQRTWVGLTDEERGQVYADWRFNGGNSSNLELCRAIEAKLKEKNT